MTINLPADLSNKSYSEAANIVFKTDPDGLQDYISQLLAAQAAQASPLVGIPDHKNLQEEWIHSLVTGRDDLRPLSTVLPPAAASAAGSAAAAPAMLLLKSFTYNFLDDKVGRLFERYSDIVIAGGSTTDLICKSLKVPYKSSKYSDLDFFILNTNKRALLELLEYIKERSQILKVNVAVVKRNSGILNFYVRNSNYKRCIQIIMTKFENMSQLLQSFDLDYVKTAFGVNSVGDLKDHDLKDSLKDYDLKDSLKDYDLNDSKDHLNLKPTFYTTTQSSLAIQTQRIYLFDGHVLKNPDSVYKRLRKAELKGFTLSRYLQSTLQQCVSDTIYTIYSDSKKLDNRKNAEAGIFEYYITFDEDDTPDYILHQLRKHYGWDADQVEVHTDIKELHLGKVVMTTMPLTICDYLTSAVKPTGLAKPTSKSRSTALALTNPSDYKQINTRHLDQHFIIYEPLENISFTFKCPVLFESPRTDKRSYAQLFLSKSVNDVDIKIFKDIVGEYLIKDLVDILHQYEPIASNYNILKNKTKELFATAKDDLSRKYGSGANFSDSSKISRYMTTLEGHEKEYLDRYESARKWNVRSDHAKIVDRRECHFNVAGYPGSYDSIVRVSFSKVCFTKSFASCVWNLDKCTILRKSCIK